MKNLGRTLATKGILGFKKVIAMATKGVLDFKHGQEPRIIVSSLLFDFDIKGKKAFKVEYHFDIIGQKEFVVADAYAVLAQKAFLLDYEKEMVGLKSLEYVTQRHVRGFCGVPLRYKYHLEGQKLVEIVEFAKIQGLKSKLMDLEIGISSQKSFSQKAECRISGGKQLEFACSKKIKGRRDLSPIFLALDD